MYWLSETCLGTSTYLYEPVSRYQYVPLWACDRSKNALSSRRVCSIKFLYVPAVLSISSSFFTNPSYTPHVITLNTIHTTTTINSPVKTECAVIQVINSPLHRIARLNPSASAVPEFMFSTTLCFTFFRTEQHHHSSSVIFATSAP